MKEGKRWLTVAVYAVAMAWVEAAVVLYLRTMIGRIKPYQPDPMPMVRSLGSVELVREFATLVMLFMVGVLAGRSWRSRFGYMCVAFGIWDIFYYVFLKLMCGWPHSLLDWDILFLIPLPWWGPVLAPMMIAMLMILWGTLATQFEQQSTPERAWPFVPALIGAMLALSVFMTDAMRVAGQGAEAIRMVLPKNFAWGSFAVAIGMMSIPVLDLAWRILQRRLTFSKRISSTKTVSETVEPAFEKKFEKSFGIFE